MGCHLAPCLMTRPPSLPLCVRVCVPDVAYRFQDLCPSTEEEEDKATLELTKECDTVEEEEGEERRAQRKAVG